MSARAERGSAVILAMLVVAVAATLVSGALWQQSALIRETENELAYAQAKWLIRGAIDWAGVILQEDARTSSVDHRGEPWAVPLADTRLNENDGRPAAYLAGAIEDEQAKFNLRNLVAGEELNVAEMQPRWPFDAFLVSVGRGRIECGRGGCRERQHVPRARCTRSRGLRRFLDDDMTVRSSDSQ